VRALARSSISALICPADPNVWIHGGELLANRWFGRFLALQVAAALRGIKPEPYTA
jgi:hypothetical protein